MTVTIVPSKPFFRSKSEEKVFISLRESLSDNDVIICNFEFTDLNMGDIEVDFILLIKDLGLVVVEVKGGHISFDGQNWIQSDSKSSRVIHPAGQAKKICIHFVNF